MVGFMQDVTTDHSTRSHSTISPSGFENYLSSHGGCLGFQPTPDTGEIHPVTAKGEELHEILEVEDLSTVSSLADYLNQTDDYDRRALDYCVNAVADFEQIHGVPNAVLVEPQVQIFPLPTGEMMKGFIDRVHLYDNWAAIFDWKFGWTPVTSAEKNWQGVLYAWGLFQEFGHITHVAVTFVQPRLGKVTTFTWDKAEVASLVNAAKVHLEAVFRGDDNEWTPNVITCSRCARVTCRHRVGLVNQIATGFADERSRMMRMFHKLETGETLPEFQIPSSIDPRYLDNGVEIAKALDLCDVLTTWVEQTKAAALTAKLEKGIEIPGWEIAYRVPNTAVEDNQAAVKVLITAGFTVDEIIDCSKMSVTKLGDKFAEKASGPSKAAKLRTMNQMLDEAGALNDRSVEQPSLKREKGKKKPADFLSR
jgi:hypothetical protein